MTVDQRRRLIVFLGAIIGATIGLLTLSSF
jgi:hypothetical protein